jgi:hypothetical protein
VDGEIKEGKRKRAVKNLRTYIFVIHKSSFRFPCTSNSMR